MKCKHENADHLMPGERHGRLTVIGRGAKRGHRWLVSVRCDCGTVKDVAPASLVSGTTKSCGCLRREIGDRTRTHGMKRTPTYRSWRAMRARCEKPHNRDWKDYGERGIVVCDRWQSFESFLADMGERPDGTSIDRFPDTNGNYEPGNCRWATQAQQQRNRRDTKIREDDLPAVLAMRTAGESTYAIARRFGVDQSTARCAIRAARAIATHEDSHE